MDFEATITSKGQVTVPIEIRKELGVKAGDKIVFKKNGHRAVTVKPARKVSPFEKYRGIGNPGIGSGLDAVIRHVREMRGFDPDDPSVE